MEKWKDVKLAKGSGPKYLRLAEEVRKLIHDRVLEPGESLPSSRQLSEFLDIHRHTITSALEDLVKQGWLSVQERKGYHVSNKLPELAGSDKSARFQWAQKIKLGEFSATTEVKYNFQSGLPDLREFPLEEYRSYFNEAVRAKNPDLLGYSSPLGHFALRESLKSYIGELRGIEDKEIIITIGSQEGLYITSRLLLKKGDYVLMEEIGYPPAKETFKAIGAKVITVKLDKEGAVPEHMADQIKRYQPKMIFLTPTHQFPTTVSMTAARKMEICQIAAANNVPIFEDDYDHEFHYTSTPPQPLARFDKAGIVLYSSTFSKLLFPGIRLGFMAVPKAFAHEFGQYRRILTHQNEILSQDVVARWIESRGIFTHLRKMRKLYHSRLDTMEECLKALNQPKLTWSRPDGGMAVWLNLGKDADLVAARALKKGVFATPESYYMVRKGTGKHLRLGFSNQNAKELKAGLALLGSCI